VRWICQHSSGRSGTGWLLSQNWKLMRTQSMLPMVGTVG
jgi:hypothetical protein